ncbi:MAG: hypothetical protein WC525_08565, partial [Candidatus Thermoplasmatota archaeon]
KATEGEVETIIQRKTEDIAKEYGITIETSAFTHGDYDWMMTFTAENIIQAKMFSAKLLGLYPHAIERMSVVQTLMFIKKHYVLNPERKKLKEFM